jgi:hypothetical protein
MTTSSGDMTSAISTETSERQSADETLQKSIVSAETNRKNGDAALQDQIDEITELTSDEITALAKEAGLVAS